MTEQAELSPGMAASSTPSIPGYEIIEHIDFLSDSMIIPVEYLTEVLTLDPLFSRFVMKAKAIGANGLVGIGMSVSEKIILIYGTAVRIERLS